MFQDIRAHWCSQSFLHSELLVCHELKPCFRLSCFFLLLPLPPAPPYCTQEEGVRGRTQTHSQRRTAGREQVRAAGRGSGYGKGGQEWDGKGGGDWKKGVGLISKGVLKTEVWFKFRFFWISFQGYLGYNWIQKVTKKCIKRILFWPKGQKEVLVKGQSSPQELEKRLHSGL